VLTFLQTKMMAIPAPAGRATPTAPHASSCIIRCDTASWRRRPGAWHRLSASQTAFSGGDVALGVAREARSKRRSAAQRQCMCQAGQEQMQVAITGESSPCSSRATHGFARSYNASCGI